MGQPHRVWEGTTQDMQSPGVHLRGSGPLLLGVGLVRQAPEGQLKPTRPLPSLLLPPWARVGDSTLGIECASGDTRARWASGGLTRQQWGRYANPPQSKQLREEGPKARPSRARPTCHVGLPERRVDSGQETTGRLLGVFTLPVSRHSSVTWS